MWYSTNIMMSSEMKKTRGLKPATATLKEEGGGGRSQIVDRTGAMPCYLTPRASSGMTRIQCHVDPWAEFFRHLRPANPIFIRIFGGTIVFGGGEAIARSFNSWGWAAVDRGDVRWIHSKNLPYVCKSKNFGLIYGQKFRESTYANLG